MPCPPRNRKLVNETANDRNERKQSEKKENVMIQAAAFIVAYVGFYYLAVSAKD